VCGLASDMNIQSDSDLEHGLLQHLAAAALRYIDRMAEKQLRGESTRREHRELRAVPKRCMGLRRRN